MSDVAKVDDIELQEITENAARSTEHLIPQLKREFTHVRAPRSGQTAQKY